MNTPFLPVHKIGVEPTKTAIAVELLGWGVCGSFVAILASGLQQRKLINRNMIPCVIVGVGCGYLCQQYEQHKLKLLEKQRDTLVKRRIKYLESQETLSE